MGMETFSVKDIAADAPLENNGRLELPDDSGRRADRMELPPDDGSDLHIRPSELPCNAEYETNGYKYHTDDQGRIVSAEGNLHIKDHEGRLQITDSMDKIGRGWEQSDDERGHLIGDQFDGSNHLDNLVPMNKDLNRGDYKKMENELASAVKDGKEVYFKVEPRYEGDSARPSMFRVTTVIGGEKSIRYFENGGK